MSGVVSAAGEQPVPARKPVPADKRRHPPGCPDADWCRGNRVCQWACTDDGEPPAARKRKAKAEDDVLWSWAQVAEQNRKDAEQPAQGSLL